MREGSFRSITITASRASTYPNARVTKKNNTRTKGRDWEGLPASAKLEEYGGLTVVGMVARKFLGWQPCVGCTFVSPLRVGMFQCRAAQATVVCVTTATR